MTHLLAIAALDFSPVLRLGTFLGEVAFLLAVTTDKVGWVSRLRTLGGFMTLLATVAATKATPSAGWAILSKVAH